MLTPAPGKRSFKVLSSGELSRELRALGQNYTEEQLQNPTNEVMRPLFDFVCSFFLTRCTFASAKFVDFLSGFDPEEFQRPNHQAVGVLESGVDTYTEAIAEVAFSRALSVFHLSRHSNPSSFPPPFAQRALDAHGGRPRVLAG